mmetsp:Transcript_80916/g.245517  ORF Transcript_80916/g.245517 Transcript_80916/m.245517 type:complete len:101 (+) Transcript_80916:1007-1309(+)
MASYRFILSPLGNGISSTKTCEALLVLTVPIVQRGGYPLHDDLAGYGFPIVIVDSWQEVTRGNLALWWEKLSPRLKSFRDNCITTEAYWRLITGQVTRCE